MQITQGFVAVKQDGTFLYVGHRSTHTGEHIDVIEVDCVERASVFSGPNFGYGYGMRHKLPTDVTFIPVEVRREVIIKGYGVTK